MQYLENTARLNGEAVLQELNPRKTKKRFTSHLGKYQCNSDWVRFKVTSGGCVSISSFSPSLILSSRLAEVSAHLCLICPVVSSRMWTVAFLLNMIRVIRCSKNRRFVQFPATSLRDTVSSVFIPVVSFPQFLHYLLGASDLSTDD